MLICRCALLAGLVVTPCFADDPENKSNPFLEVVSVSERPPAVASGEANKKVDDESVSALSKAVEELESRIAELERITNRGKLGPKAKRSKATASNRQSGHGEIGERELRLYQLKKTDPIELSKRFEHCLCIQSTTKYSLSLTSQPTQS